MSQVLLDPPTLDTAGLELSRLLEQVEMAPSSEIQDKTVSTPIESSAVAEPPFVSYSGESHAKDQTLSPTALHLNDDREDDALSTEHVDARPHHLSGWSWLVQSLVLTVLGGGSLLGGIVLAHFHPALVAETPVLEQTFEQTSNFYIQGREFIQHASRSLFQKLADGVGWDASKKDPLNNVSAVDLSVTDRQQFAIEFERLQVERHALALEIAQLEQKMGIRPKASDLTPSPNNHLHTHLGNLDSLTFTGSLETRLHTIDQILNPSAAMPDLDDFRVTLPTHVLFQDGAANLYPDAVSLLDTIVQDIQRYGPIGVTIAVHTDNVGDSSANQDLSFRQGQAVANYLQTHLGSNYRWTVLGYGESQSLVDNSTHTNRQRNRRLEITLARLP